MTRPLDWLLRVGTAFYAVRRKRSFQLWSVATAVALVVLLFLPGNARIPPAAWALLALAALPGALLLGLGIVMDALLTTVSILLTCAFVVYRLARAVTTKVRSTTHSRSS